MHFADKLQSHITLLTSRLRVFCCVQGVRDTVTFLEKNKDAEVLLKKMANKKPDSFSC